MKKFLLFSILISALFLFSSSLTAQEKLQYQWKKGQVLKYSINNQTHTVQEMNGNEIKNDVSMESIISKKADSALPDGYFLILSTVEYMKAKAKLPAGDTVLNFKEMEGKVTRQYVDSKGETRNANREKEKSIDLGFGNISMNADVVEFPTEKVFEGYSWSKEGTDTVPEGEIVINYRNEYQVAGKEKKNNHDCIKINFSGKNEMAGKLFQMGMEMYLEGSGDSHGTIWFDNSAGVIVAKETNLNFDMTVALAGEMKMTIPITQTTTVTETLKE